MKTRATIAGVLMVSLSIVVPGTVFSQSQHSFLKSGGVDNESVAEAYYNTIDPDNLRPTQDAWLEVNGYNDPINEVIEVKGHFSDGDLAFWRSISLVNDKRDGYEGNIAFTTANYNTEMDALYGTNPISIVNMEYSPGPEDDLITKFYVFNVKKPGERVNSTFFDSNEEQLHLPAGCFSCHGGDDDAEVLLPNDGYNDGSGETNATFLAFDIRTMKFGDTTQASLEEGIKKLNEAVLGTDPTKATRKLIKGLYGGPGLPRDKQDLDYIPASWVGEEYLYKVIVSTCQGCHATSDTKLLSLQWWKSNAASIREVVFHEGLMPDSMPAFDRFWSIEPKLEDRQYMIVLEALNRFEFPE